MKKKQRNSITFPLKLTDLISKKYDKCNGKCSENHENQQKKANLSRYFMCFPKKLI